MATKITTEDIFNINRLYNIHKTYAEVARQTGFSASTVKKYVDKNWTPPIESVVKFDMNSLPFYGKAIETFRAYEDYGLMCGLSDKEKEEIKLLWNELSV